MDNAKVSQLLECITCQDSWEDIKNWYRVSGQFENEVIVEGMDPQVKSCKGILALLGDLRRILSITHIGPKTIALPQSYWTPLYFLNPNSKEII